MSRGMLRHCTTGRLATWGTLSPRIFSASAISYPSSFLLGLARGSNRQRVARFCSDSSSSRSSSKSTQRDTNLHLKVESDWHDVLSIHKPAKVMELFIRPKAVAVIGASARKGSVSRDILENLLMNPFGGTVFPVSKTRSQVLGVAAYADLASIPQPVDLAIIVTPAPSIPEIMRDCVNTGVKACIIISAGFAEAGDSGKALQKEVMGIAQKGNIRIIGPNCLGLISPITGLNASFSPIMPKRGNIGFLSQSGALGTALLDWGIKNELGFSHFVSGGALSDVSWHEMLTFLGDDPETHAIVCYMESLGEHAKQFAMAAREVSASKPIIVIKAGRTQAAVAAAASHTGSVAGSDQVADALFRECGVIRVDTIAEMWHLAEALDMQRLPKGPRLGIVTNAGGPAIVATDELVGNGGILAEISTRTIESLNEVLPPNWSRRNPMDVLGDAQAQRYADALKIASTDPEIDGLLVILTPQSMTESSKTAEYVVKVAESVDIPVLANWMGGPSVKEGQDILRHGNVPNSEFPDTQARTFRHLWEYQAARNHIRWVAAQPFVAHEHPEASTVAEVQATIANYKTQDRVSLSELESKEILGAYGIPVTPMRLASSEDEAVEAAKELGFPVCVKLNSHTILHKSDVGGVRLNLTSSDSIRKAFSEIQSAIAQEDFEGVTVQPMITPSKGTVECILGVTTDAQCGPIVAFGMGGTLVEAFKDVELAVPPLNREQAKNLIGRTKISKILAGVRGNPPCNMPALEEALMRLSDFAVNHPFVREIDLNPVQVRPDGLMALDGRVILWPATTAEADIPRPLFRPYPRQYAAPGMLKDGERVLIRPCAAADESKLHDRYFATLHEGWETNEVAGGRLEGAAGRLSRLCFADYDREITLLCESKSGEAYGTGRLSRGHEHSNLPEFGIYVDANHINRGVATLLVSALLRVARCEGIDRVETRSRSHSFADWLQKDFGAERLPDDGPFVRLKLSTT